MRLILELYEKDGIDMSYTMEDFRREYAKTIEEEQRLLALEIVKRLPPEGRLQGLPVEDRLKGRSADEIERYLRQLQARTFPGESASAE
jgi:hypothetical protein